MDSKGLLVHIEGADWNCEIGAITEIVAFSDRPRAVLFDSIKGYPRGYRVTTNLYVSQKLQAIALDLDENLSGLELVKAWRKKMQALKSLPPKEVSDGPIKENVMEGSNVNVLKFPVPLWHELDGGRYIGTGDVVITKDPEEGWVNLGVYRSQVHDGRTIGLMILPSHHGRIIAEKYWKKERDLPVVMTVGQDPDLYAAACAPLPWGCSELEFAGGLKGEPIEVIIDEDTGLPVPAHAEIAIIGYVPPPQMETRNEGPFGECTGYFTKQGSDLIFHIEKIWYRNNPILQGNPPMHGSAIRHALGAHLITSSRVWETVEKEVPNVVGVFSLYQQCQTGSEILVISLKQSYPGHAKHAALAALSSSSTIAMSRIVITVDEDIDPSNIEEVLWALVTRCDPSEDIDIIRGVPSTALNPRIPPEKRDLKDFTFSVMIVNACKPFAWKDTFPKSTILNPELRSKIMLKWGEKLNLK